MPCFESAFSYVIATLFKMMVFNHFPGKEIIHVFNIIKKLPDCNIEIKNWIYLYRVFLKGQINKKKALQS